MGTRKLFLKCLIVLFVVCKSNSLNELSGEENCETLPSEIHLIKGKKPIPIKIIASNNKKIILEEYDELGRLQRTCNGEVAVNKCEGTCNSQVQPSVITPTGFLKVK